MGEVVGRNGIAAENYNDFLLGKLRTDGLNGLTIHAEVEGIRRAELFDRFVRQAMERGAGFVPLGELLKAEPTPFPKGSIQRGTVVGREGWAACQSPAV